MVEFGQTNYFHAMDRPLTYQLKNMGIKELGSSARMGDVLQSLKGEITAGASHVELVFSGAGKGSLSGNSTNPEMFDKRKREEIRQLAKINEVSLTTHASVAVSGAAGFDTQSNTFSDRKAKETLNEIKRTIEFASDTARGGAIVVHTSEFPRDIKDERLQMTSPEEEVAYFADSETGKVVAFKKNEVIYIPKWKKDANGNYIDIDGKIIDDPRKYIERVPELKKNGEPEIIPMKFLNFENDIKDYNAKHPEKPMNPGKEFLFFRQLQRLQGEEPRVYQYFREYQRNNEAYLKMKKDVEVWKELEKKTENKERLFHVFQQDYGKMIDSAGIKKDGKLPSAMLQETAEIIKKEAAFYREGYFGFQQQIEQIKREHENIDDIEKVGVKRSARTFAEAAMYAYRLEKQKKLEKPLFVCPENIFAEFGYGAHPQELRTLIISSRKEMAEMLVAQGMEKKEAGQVAEQHIKATFDIGHANTWAKYFKEDPKKTPEENKKEFDKWLMDEATKLVKEGIIGHVHMSDNFGYFDEHLNAGEGNAPIGDFLKVLKDSKYEGKIVIEWGAQGPDETFGANLAAWANIAGSPIYRVEGVAPRWSDIENTGYFATSHSPFMVMGKYGTALGKDWQMWSYSEAPIE